MFKFLLIKLQVTLILDGIQDLIVMEAFKLQGKQEIHLQIILHMEKSFLARYLLIMHYLEAEHFKQLKTHKD